MSTRCVSAAAGLSAKTTQRHAPHTRPSRWRGPKIDQNDPTLETKREDLIREAFISAEPITPPAKGNPATPRENNAVRSLGFSKTTTPGIGVMRVMGLMGSADPEADKNVRAPKNVSCAPAASRQPLVIGVTVAAW